MLLTDRQLRALQGPCERSVGGCPGLIVRVLSSGLRTFALRLRVNGEQRSYSIGQYPRDVSLAEARDKANELRKALRRGEDPRAPTLSTGFADAIDGWMEAAAHDHEPKTLETYRIATRKLLQWADKRGVRRTTDLDRAGLADLRAFLASLPKETNRRGGARGEKVQVDEKRSPVSVNRELRTLKTILNALRRQGRLPQLDRDAITDNLGALQTVRDEPTYLRSPQLQQLLEACYRHDSETFTETRAEHAGELEPGSTRRYQPILEFTLFLLLTGMRRGEALAVSWEDVDLDVTDHDGKRVGEIRLTGAITKTGRARTLYLDVSPLLRRMLAAMRLRSGGRGRIFSDFTVNSVKSARSRLIATYGAPAFDWQSLRSTCATFLTNSRAIYGSATVYLSARQLGHSVAIAEKHYLSVERSIPAEARTLEAAMRVEDVARKSLGWTSSCEPAVSRLAAE